MTESICKVTSIEFYALAVPGDRRIAANKNHC